MSNHKKRKAVAITSKTDGAPKHESEAVERNKERDFWQAEYGIIIDQFHMYYDIHVRAFGVYLGVTAILFGYVIEKVPEQRTMMAAIGLAFSTLYFAVLMCGITIINRLYRRRVQALGRLTSTSIEDDIRPAGRWSCYIFLVAVVVVVSGWIYLLMYWTPKPDQPKANQARLDNRWGSLLSSMISSNSDVNHRLHAQRRPSGVSA